MFPSSERVNELKAWVFPSSERLGEEGWLRHQENAAKRPLKVQTGWCFENQHLPQ
jgi:hypothetical protein